MVGRRIRLAGFVVCALMLSILLSSCAVEKEAMKTMDILVTPFGKTPDGEQGEIYVLTNSSGVKATIMTYGGILVSLEVPDKDGNLDKETIHPDFAEQWEGTE